MPNIFRPIEIFGLISTTTFLCIFGYCMLTGFHEFFRALFSVYKDLLKRR